MSRTRHSALLRAAGLKVTPARLAALEVAPALLECRTHLAPQALLEAAVRHGHAMSFTTAYRLIPTLVEAGLLPARALARPAPSRANPARTPLETKLAMRMSAVGVRVSSLRIAALQVCYEMSVKPEDVRVPDLLPRLRERGHAVTRRGLYKLWSVFRQAGLLREQ